MKTKMSSILILLSILISCKKEVSNKITAVAPQLVAQSFFAPGDDSIRVELDYSKNYFGDQQSRNQLLNSIPKATVQIESSGNTKTLMWSKRNRYFVISTREMPLIANKAYHLTVVTAEGLKAEAISTIPSMIEEVTMSKTVGKPKDQSRTDRINMSIKDEKGKENYYQFKLFFFTESQGFNQNYEIGQKLDHDHQDLSEIVAVSFSHDLYLGNGGGGTGAKSYYQGYFIKATEEYYKYLESSKKNNDAGGNPFAEPVSNYTNIKGGLGVFAAYQIFERKVTTP